jgi:flagellin
MLSIQTNVNSLVAQQNLSVNSAFQSKTIQQLTSGYRINSSGDDAAGLAVANKFRNATAELTQGVANGNNAVAQLQIMDGGMSNISQILDRLKTLAMQASSATATASDRGVLNNEFQTDVQEIDRQAQSIGLNTGGTFAKSLGIYLGAGSGSTDQSNSVVNVDLSKATVDSQSLGLAGVTAVNVNSDASTDYDLGAGTTSVANIITANTATADFTFTGPGFGGTGATAVTIQANLTGVSDTASLVSALNTALQAKGAAGADGGGDAAFAAAGITASIHTDSAGKEQLAFTSSNAAFQVAATNTTSEALMGSFNGATATGSGTAQAFIASGSYELGTAASGSTPASENDIAWAGAALTGTQDVTISANDSGGVAHLKTVTFDAAGAGAVKGDTMAHYVQNINDQLQSSNDSTLKQVTAVANAAGTAINFISTNPQFSVVVGAANAGKGLTPTASQSAIQVGTASTSDISTMSGAQAAVTAITAAVTALGNSQAAIGKGENQLGYAINLATSQITNNWAAESAIRDANVAQQAANLTKAQVLQQASIAAMAQANSAPQAVLKLLG